MKKSRFLSLVLCIFVLFVNMHAITAKAAPLNKADAAKIARAIANDQMTFGKNSRKGTGKEVIVQSFQITNLSAPQNGNLLDTTATVVSDSGYSWDIPVLWVDQDGNLIQVAIEIENIRSSYPIFAFYLPDGYTFVFNESTFNIGMPDFVCKLMEKTGVATIANPAIGVTYITALLPGQNKFLAKQPVTASGVGGNPSDAGESGGDDKLSNGEEPQVRPSDSKSKLQWKTYNPKLTEDQKKYLTSAHCDENAVEKLGIDDLAWLVSFVKEVLEPEAVSLLESSFPAYKTASENKELGKEIGLYVFYDNVYNGETVVDKSDTVAFVESKSDLDGTYSYRIGVNASKFFTLDEKTNTYVFGGDDAYNTLDNSLVHEMMHAFMDDYTRSGMDGMQYDPETDTYSEDNSKNVKFPTWFIEGIATATDNAYQYWNETLHGSYGYDTGKSQYSGDALKEAYLSNEDMTLSFADENSSKDVRKSAYVSGYLANVYLGYLAAVKYDSKDAISGKASDGSLKISNEVILSGVNHIIEQLHNGKTLDEVIAVISTDSSGNQLYSSADDFAAKFIASSAEGVGDDNKSLDFCTTFLNYLESNSSKNKTVNGSILLDFKNTSEHQLDKKLIKNLPKDYIPSNGKDFAESSVDTKKALESGGKSETGIAESSSSASDSSSSSSSASSGESTEDGGDEETTEIAAKTDNTVEDAASSESCVDEEEDAAASEDSTDDSAKEASNEEASELQEESAEDISDEAPSEDSLTESAEEEDITSEDEEIMLEDPQTEEVEEVPQAEEVQEAPQTEEPQVEAAPEEENVPHSVVISNAEEQNNEDDSSNNSCEEQVLDAIPQDNSDEEDAASADTVPEE